MTMAEMRKYFNLGSKKAALFINNCTSASRYLSSKSLSIADLAALSMLESSGLTASLSLKSFRIGARQESVAH